MSVFILIAAGAAPLAGPDPILVRAARMPVEAEQSGVSSTVIDERRIEARGDLQAIDLLRTVPGVAVSVSGAPGSQAQLRIRGAEANHSLLYVDGIAFNIPAAGNEARFEDILAAGLARIEVVRGPQSALWGSEALGGVIALESPDPLGGPRLRATAEYGSRDSLRGVVSTTLGDGRRGITLTASRAEEDGIDILGGGSGDRDGFENTTLAMRAAVRPRPNGEIGVAARYVDASVAFDGSDPVTFLRADTADTTDAETAAVRGWAEVGTDAAMPWALRLDGQYLWSENRNFLAEALRNETAGDRFRIGAQLERRLEFAETAHRLVAAVEREDESFRARDREFAGATDQDRSRGRTAFIGEWRADWGGGLATDVAIRHDDFSAFEDATTLRALASLQVSERVSLHGSYGEGIAQPTFFDLYGFFPGSFAGNPGLRPESARGYEIGAEWRSETVELTATAFRSVLEDEIVAVFDPVTFLSSTANASGKSERMGVEVSAAWHPLQGLRIDASYTFLDADDQQVAGGAELDEVRRPGHSASLAFDYRGGPWTLGGSVAFVGARTDIDFDLFPAEEVTLGAYALASARIGYALAERIEIFARATNLFDEEYRDVVGYRTPGVAAYAGLRLRLGD